MKLTTKLCEEAGPKPKVYRLSDGNSLFLEVHPKGQRYWRMRYSYAQQARVLALGKYPEVGIDEARAKRDDARKLLSQGIDPVQHGRLQRVEAMTQTINTFEALAREWHSNWKVDKTAKHADAILSRFENDVFPVLGKLPVRSITPQMILQVVRIAEARKAYDVAHRIKQTCSQILRYGVATGRADTDVTRDLSAAMRPYKAEHFAALDIRELPEFLKMLDYNEMRVHTQTRLAMKMLMLTFVRTNELIKARWEEFNFEEAEWLIPGKRMKMKKDHLVPLSRQALAILQQLKAMNGHREWVFPSMARPRNPMCNATIIKAIQRMGYKDRMTGHGFRPLAMTTIMEKLSYRFEVVDRQLAHSKRSKIRAAYDRAEFLTERRKMMQDYADYIDQITS